jgi:hypothetical protein
VAFPWDNLITAVSTLAAALGGVGLMERGARKERKAEAIRRDELARSERRRVAYADLVTTAGDVLLYFQQRVHARMDMIVGVEVNAERGLSGEESGKQLERTISIVQLVGSNAARIAARAVHDATVVVSRLFTTSKLDRKAADAAFEAMFNAIDGFLDAVRPETAPDAETPRRL